MVSLEASGKIHWMIGTMIFEVFMAENVEVDIMKMTTPHSATGSQSMA
jgi:hypothetical protein